MIQIPEGRQPLSGADMAKLHPSTWRQECEELRRDYGLMQIDRNNLRSLLDATEAKADELHDKLDDAQSEAKALRARVQELEMENGIIRTDKHADAECIGHLERRVQELEAIALDYRHVLHSAKAGRDLYCGFYVAKEYRFTREQIDAALAKISAALQKQEGGE